MQHIHKLTSHLSQLHYNTLGWISVKVCVWVLEGVKGQSAQPLHSLALNFSMNSLHSYALTHTDTSESVIFHLLC